jgi:hypothetical protein
MNPVIGVIYNVKHSRKGNFTMRATGFDEEWITGIIVDSTAKAMLDYNVKTSGDEITIRRSHCHYFAPVNSDANFKP